MRRLSASALSEHGLHLVLERAPLADRLAPRVNLASDLRVLRHAQHEDAENDDRDARDNVWQEDREDAVQVRVHFALVHEVLHGKAQQV